MKYFKKSLLLAVALFTAGSVAQAAPYPAPPQMPEQYYQPARSQDNVYRERITLEFYASKYFTINQRISRVFVGNGDIIKVKQPANSPSEFVITAGDKKGSTTLFVWTADGTRHEYLVNVVDEEIGQAEIIQQAIGLPNVHVKKVGERILLTGSVQNQYERNYALQTAALYVDDDGSNNNLSVGSNVDMKLDVQSATSGSSGSVDTNTLESTGKIIDLLEMENPYRIRLEAQVIQITSKKAKELGVQYQTGTNGFGTFIFGEDYTREKTVTEYYRTYDSDGIPSISSASYNAHNIPFRENPARWLEEHFSPINAQISALVTKGDAKVLSRPNITTMSGEQATIHIGGKLPYRSVNSNGASSVQFEDYGIILQFKPIVDAHGRITSAVHTEVSSLDGYTEDNQPKIATRSADAVVNVYSGSTIVVGGLMDSSESKNINKIPLLGDIPILGEFFKYTSKSRDKTELVIVVTPHLIGVEDTTHARVSEDMRDLYHAGQREMNEVNQDVDFNAPPPPVEDKKDKKDKKKKKYTKDKQDKKSEDVVISDYNSEGNKTNNNDKNVEVFDSK